MKKSLLALAVLGAFSSIAAAQSSVTLYGRVDLSLGRNSNSEDNYLANGSGSRLGLRGVEDLGGGLQALFNIEHRYNADTGAQTNASRFWQGRSLVGLQGGFGQIVLGREYTTAFLQSQLVADPWGYDTVASNTAGAGLPAGSLGPGQTAAFNYGGTIGIFSTGNIGKVRNDSSITYKITASGFTFGAQVAEGGGGGEIITNPPYSTRPWNVALSYAGGPITVGVAYERTGREGTSATSLSGDDVTENVWDINAAYNFGAFKIGGWYSKGESFDTGLDHKSYAVTATAPIGAGELRALYGILKAEDAAPEETANRVIALGYHYSLSKRTTIYADVVNNSNKLAREAGLPADNKTGYDVGIKHNF